MLIARLVLAINAVVMGLIGIAYLIDPNILLSNYGLAVDSVAMDNMLRSAYGGLSLAMASVFGLGAITANWRAKALGLLALYMGGMAIGRIASIALAGLPGASINTLLAYEVFFFCVAMLLLRRSTASQ